MSKEKSRIIINPDQAEPYTHLDWAPYKGREVEVIYKKQEDIVVPQLVTSEKLIRLEDERIADYIHDFLLRAESRMGPFYKIAEAGRWAIKGKDVYASSIFTSYSINSIKPEDALPRLVDTVKEALSNEPESDLQGLILMHTHPKPNSPLSPGDYTTAETLARDFGIEKGDIIQVMAIPINENGNLIFRYDLKI